MLINTDLSANTALASLQNQRTSSSAAASQTSSAPTDDSAASQLEPSLQRLTDVPSTVQEVGGEIQDEQEAGLTVELARQGILGQPRAALGAQANQLPQNVLSLLQSTD
jgi:flagellin